MAVRWKRTATWVASPALHLAAAKCASSSRTVCNPCPCNPGPPPHSHHPTPSEISRPAQPDPTSLCHLGSHSPSRHLAWLGI
ncbi:hypothetical protein M758_1G192900 [Ceratodon purpureus]|nr:hypothetical protein M758_1G192900 [Ceratodon purpureus]